MRFYLLLGINKLNYVCYFHIFVPFEVLAQSAYDEIGF
jgi:hypothetical protein